MAFIEVVDWGGETTPFQLAGSQPVSQGLSDGRLEDYADGHLGFLGYLKLANGRILHRLGFELMDLPDCLWRDAYGDGVHPIQEADEALREAGL